MSQRRQIRKHRGKLRLLNLGQLTYVLGEVVKGNMYLTPEEAQLVLRGVDILTRAEGSEVRITYKSRARAGIENRLGILLDSDCCLIHGVRFIVDDTVCPVSSFERNAQALGKLLNGWR